MSRADNDNRKSKKFTFEDFEKEWSALEQAAKAATSSETNGTGNKAPAMKVKAQEKEQVRPTVTQTDTGDGNRNSGAAEFTHTPPVTTSRSEKPKKLDFSSTVKSSDGPSTSPRKIDKSFESPRRGNITHREAEKIPSNESPSTTPRGRGDEKSPIPNNSSARKFRKEVSRKFADIKLNLSGVSEKISTARISPPSSPGSSGRVSPSKISPRKKISNLLKDVPVEARNQAAKAYLKLQQDPVYQKADAKRKSILLNAKMIGVLSDKKIALDGKKPQALAVDAEARSKNMIVDMEVDLTDPKFADFYSNAADAAFMKPWSKDSSDITDPNGRPMGDKTKVKPTFIRDFRNSVYQQKEKNGSIRTIASIEEFLDFFASDDNQEMGMMVSNVASQNLGVFFKNVLFRRQDKDGQCQSILRLADGTPIQPLANFKAKYVLSRDSAGNIIIDYESHCDSSTGKGELRATKVQGNPQTIEVGDHASITIKTRVTFAPDGEWSIDDPHVYAEFWNTEKES